MPKKEKEVFEAIGDKILLEPEKQVKSAIYVPDEVKKQGMENRGRVLSIGSDVKLDIKVGDILTFHPNACDVILNGEDMLFLVHASGIMIRVKK